jgi:DNA-binding IclR family transcriptional regulator
MLALGDERPLTPAELADRLQLNRTVVHRLLTTLNARGFVRRHAHAYSLGPTLVQLSKGVEPDLRAASIPAMKLLAEATGETAVTHVPDGNDAVVLEQVVANRYVLRVDHEIGSRHPLTQGASGRAILARLPEAEQRRVLRATDAEDEVPRQLDAIRQMGYALSHDELQMGVHGIAAPVIGPDGVAIASVALLVPAIRAGSITSHVEALRAAAAAIAAPEGARGAAA